jgi:hypothetical protein
LKTLPETIGQLTELQALFLAYNALETLPATLWNCINLEHLNIEHNEVKELSEGIGQCLKLERLYMSKSLKKFPYTLGRCSRLEIYTDYEPKSFSIPQEVAQCRSRWPKLEADFLKRASAIVDYFSKSTSFQMPLDLQEVVVSYIGCETLFASPTSAMPKKALQQQDESLAEPLKAFALLKESLQASLKALLESYKCKANTASTPPPRGTQAVAQLRS